MGEFQDLCMREAVLSRFAIHPQLLVSSEGVLVFHVNSRWKDEKAGGEDPKEGWENRVESI